jgi:hypothetical protein
MMQIINYRGKLIEIAAVKMELISLEEPWLIWKDENIITLTITRSRGRDMYGFLAQCFGQISKYDVRIYKM